jgi:hypothetical protein
MKSITIGSNISYKPKSDAKVKTGRVIGFKEVLGTNWFKVCSRTKYGYNETWVTSESIMGVHMSIQKLLAKSFGNKSVEERTNEDFPTYCFRLYKKTHLILAENPISFKDWLICSFKEVNKLKKQKTKK